MWKTLPSCAFISVVCVFACYTKEVSLKDDNRSTSMTKVKSINSVDTVWLSSLMHVSVNFRDGLIPTPNTQYF